MNEAVTTRVVQRDELTPEFLEQVAALYDRAFDGWPRIEIAGSPADHLAWKANGPLPGFPALLIAEVDGQLAGCRTILARNILVRHQPKLFLHFVDGAVDPPFQGRGANRAIQQRMHDEFETQYDLSIDDSTNPHMIRGRERVGDTYEFGNAVRPYVLPLNASALARSQAGRLPAPIAALRLRLGSLTSRLGARGDRGALRPGTLQSITAFDDRFDPFCAEASAPFDFICERNAAFLNWRYADPRAGAFTIRIAERDGELRGYAVTKHTSDALHIVDLLVTPGDADAVATLIEDAVSRARALEAPAVSCWLPSHHPYATALRAAGFLLLGDTAVVYRPASMPAEELAFLKQPHASMHFTYGDTDFI